MLQMAICFVDQVDVNWNGMWTKDLGVGLNGWMRESYEIDVVCENPYSVRLRFEPKGIVMSIVVIEYWISIHSITLRNRLLQIGKPKKESLNVTDNICVVCGNNTNYVSHSILPPRYRRCLPEQWKSHNNYDNVVLCVSKKSSRMIVAFYIGL